MSLVLRGVDATEAGQAVLAAAKAAAGRAGAPLLTTHVATSLWGSTAPVFHLDDRTERLVEQGPPAQRLLAVAEAHDADLIVVGTRARRWRSVARQQVVKGARCPVMIVGPAADPRAEPEPVAGFDRGRLLRAPSPVVVAPAH